MLFTEEAFQMPCLLFVFLSWAEWTAAALTLWLTEQGGSQLSRGMPLLQCCGVDLLHVCLLEGGVGMEGYKSLLNRFQHRSKSFQNPWENGDKISSTYSQDVPTVDFRNLRSVFRYFLKGVSSTSEKNKTLTESVVIALCSDNPGARIMMMCWLIIAVKSLPNQFHHLFSIHTLAPLISLP